MPKTTNIESILNRLPSIMETNFDVEAFEILEMKLQDREAELKSLKEQCEEVRQENKSLTYEV